MTAGTLVRKLHSSLVAVGLLLMFFSSYSISEQDRSAADERTGADPQLDCLIEPNKRIDVSSPVRGVLKAVYVVRGNRVKKNQKLFELRSDLEAAEVKTAAARAEFGTRTEVRNDDLYQQELISIHEKDELETDSKLASLTLEEAKVRLSMKQIYSPISGFVTERMKSEGEYVEEEPVLTLVSIDPLYVEVVVPIEFLGKISKGMKAKVTPESPMDSTHTAEVIIVDPIVDAASGTIRVRLELANKKFAVPAGLKCKVEFGVE